MANARLRWTLPTTRESGNPLPPEAISHVRIEISASGGQVYALIGDFPPSVLETLLQDLDFGTYRVRGLVADTAGQVSAPLFADFEIVQPVDNTPPSALAELIVELE